MGKYGYWCLQRQDGHEPESAAPTAFGVPFEGMQLHVPTMLVTTIVSAVLVSVVLRFAGTRHPGAGLAEATLSAVCFALSCTLILLKGVIPDAVRLVPANGLMWLAFALQWLAYTRFDTPARTPALPLGLTAAATAAFALLQAMGADYRERSIYASCVVAALALASGRQLLAGGGLQRERARILGVFFAGMTVVCQIVRVPLLLAMPSGEGALLSGSLEQSVAFLPAMVHVLGVGLGFLVMHLERNEAQAQAAAHTDPLTGCANRRAFAARVRAELAHLARCGAPVSILLTDIDRFKAVNDTLGHAAGDAVIRHLAGLLCEGVRPTDLVARFGGEEFCVLVRGANAADAAGLAARLATALRARPPVVDGSPVPITASFGVAEAAAGEAWEALFARADQALYASKHAGRDRVTVAA